MRISTRTLVRSRRREEGCRGRIRDLLGLLAGGRQRIVCLHFVGTLSVRRVSRVLGVAPGDIQGVVCHTVRHVRRKGVRLLFLLVFLEWAVGENYFTPL